MRHTTSVRVRYVETDQMGIVYHTHYLVWCEIGRTEFIRSLGTAYADLERHGLMLAVAEASIRYAAPARYDDVVHVHTRVERVQSRSITFAYELARASPEPTARLATASTKLIALDRSGALRTLPAELMDRFRHVRSSPP